MDIIQVEKRNEKASAKQLRRDGIIPCSVYGGQLPEDISIQMSQKSAEQLFRLKHEGSTLYLELEGKKIPVLVKEKTKDSLGSQILHIGFEALKADTPVNSVAHIVLENVDLVPGMVEQLVFEVPFTSLPKDMIDTVAIDLKGMPVGTALTLEDIPQFKDEAVTVKIPMDSLVLHIHEKQTAAEEDTEAEA